MDRVVSILLTLLAVALGVLYKVQDRQLHVARPAAAFEIEDRAVSSEVTAAAETASIAIATNLPEVAAAAPAESNAVHRRTAADYYHQVIWRMRNREGLRKNNAARALSHVNKDYATLIKYLPLDTASSDALVRLLQLKREIRLDLWSDLYNSEHTPAERELMSREAEKKRDDVEMEIERLLGKEMYPIYEEYVDTLPERRELEPYKTKLYAAGMDLSWDQENEMLLMMQEESRKMVTAEEDPILAEVATLLPEQRAASEQELWLRRTEVNNQRYLEAAKAILTPEQYEIYADSLGEDTDQVAFHKDAFPGQEIESNEGAPVAVGSPKTPLPQPVTVPAATTQNEIWGDGAGGSKASIHPVEGNVLDIQTDLGSGWGNGITFLPGGTAPNADGSLNAQGAKTITARIYAPAGVNLRFGVTESGSGWSGSKEFPGENGADGEAFRHAGVTTKDGWQTYTIPLSDLKLNGGWGNQKGNRTVDTQAIRGLEILVPGGQADVHMQVDWVRLQ